MAKCHWLLCGWGGGLFGYEDKLLHFLQCLQLAINHRVTYEGVTRARKLGEIPQRLDLCVYRGSNVVEGVFFFVQQLCCWLREDSESQIRMHPRQVRCLKPLNGKHRRCRPRRLVCCTVWTWPISPPLLKKTWHAFAVMSFASWRLA